ncbi:MAG: hypothetical protein AVDCRST_MAG73-208, partial [uncultured Thermomicrobiales bacterium]
GRRRRRDPVRPPNGADPRLGNAGRAVATLRGTWLRQSLGAGPLRRPVAAGGAVFGGLDAALRAGDVDRAGQDRGPRLLQHVPAPGAAGEAGGDRRPRLRRPVGGRAGGRVVRAGARDVRPPVPAAGRAGGAVPGGGRGGGRAAAARNDHVRRAVLPATGRDLPSGAGAAPASAAGARRPRAEDAGRRRRPRRRLELLRHAGGDTRPRRPPRRRLRRRRARPRRRPPLAPVRADADAGRAPLGFGGRVSGLRRPLPRGRGRGVHPPTPGRRRDRGARRGRCAAGSAPRTIPL